MKIINIVADISEEANGVTPVIIGLSKSLLELGNSVSLACLGVKDRLNGVDIYLSSQSGLLKKFEISFDLAFIAWRAAKRYDIVHNHGLWSMINIACGFIVPGKRAKLVVSPHGTLSPWALSNSRIRKRFFWSLQSRIILKADLLHATSTDELNDIRRLGFTAPIALIPNGIEIPNLIVKSKLTEHKTLLFLSRIHPIKGINLLLHAWRNVQDNFKDWRLVIAGKGDEAYVNSLMKLAESIGADRVDFPGPLYGSKKRDAYSEANVFILPTHSENFGMAVAEALAFGCPAIVGRGAPWASLVDNQCGWWIENNVDSLTETLSKVLSMDIEYLSVMGLRGRAWMERDYGWAAIGEKMDAAYRWLLTSGDRPAWVKVD